MIRQRSSWKGQGGSKTRLYVAADERTVQMKMLIAATLIIATLGISSTALAQPGAGPRHNDGIRLEGLSVDQAKTELIRDGYTKSKNIRVNGRQFDLWSNARARDACVGFTSLNGRVTETRSFDDAECGVASGAWGPGGFRPSALQGLRVDDAKKNLRNFGFSHDHNIRIDGQQWDLWANGRDCVGFTSYNGTVSGARDFRRGECDDARVGGWGGGFMRPDRLRGLSVDAAKRELSTAGFDKGRNIRIDGRQWDLWYNDYGRDAQCVGFTSYNGRVTDARNFQMRECR